MAMSTLDKIPEIDMTIRLLIVILLSLLIITCISSQVASLLSFVISIADGCEMILRGWLLVTETRGSCNMRLLCDSCINYEVSDL